ncbi:MAG: phage head-tail connector protein [Phycisphaerales bacterium]|nr:phage head-tail connector protein [Phycisphaerales bacterium]
MSLTITSEPAVEPLDLDDVKCHLRIDGDEEDERLERMITAARQFIEQVTWRQLITATYAWKLDRLCGVLYVPRPPLQSVASIAYIDANGDSQTFSSSLYTVDIAHDPGRILPAYNQSWPNTRGHIQDATITFDAGYGDAADDVPAAIREALLLKVEELYRPGCDAITNAIMHMLSPYRVYDTRIIRNL